ncbi:hypothetical protein FRC15_006764 [Serendipita sp. 397]|nr:hypothetical protein FRC15_006764 [Serendipita sp. 397]
MARPRATILLHDPHADPSAPECRSADKLLTAARAILDLVYILRATSFDITHLDPVASFAWFLAARVFVRLLRARLDGRRIAEAVALRAELEVIRLALKKLGERVPLGFRQSKMLDDLLANEVGNALDDPSTYSYAFTTTSPDGQQSSIALPPNGSPTDTYTNVNGHRGSFSGPPGVSPATTHLPHLGHRDSLSLPHDPHLSAHSGMNSRRTSFSAQGTTTAAGGGGGDDGLPLPRDGNTKNVMLHQLPTMMNISYDSNVPHSTPDSATLQTPQFGVPLPPVTDIHHKFMESMKSQDERDLEVYHESGAAAAVGEIPAPGVGGGRLEMLLGEMVDDGDGDGVFGGVSGMGVLGANMGNNNGFPIGSGVGIAGTGIGFVNEYGLVTGGW